MCVWSERSDKHDLTVQPLEHSARQVAQQQRVALGVALAGERVSRDAAERVRDGEAAVAVDELGLGAAGEEHPHRADRAVRRREVATL